MDTNSEEIKNFALLLTQVEKPVRITILKHLTTRQCEFVRQIATNILLNGSLNLDTNAKSYIRNNLSEIKKLASKLVCKKLKRNILVKKQQMIKKLALLTVQYLQK